MSSDEILRSPVSQPMRAGQVGNEAVTRVLKFLQALAPLAAAGTLVASLVVFVNANHDWLGLFRQLRVSHPLDVHPFDLQGLQSLLPVVLFVLIVSAIASALTFREPLALSERLLWTVLFAVVIIGLPAVALAMVGVLYFWSLVCALAAIGTAVVTVMLRRSSVRVVTEWWTTSEVTSAPVSNDIPLAWKGLLVAYLLLMAGALLFHAISKPIYDYDAAIYHAAMGKILANFHGMPVITGPSPGIEMSANYPPLFPALGAFTLILSGGNDIGLRALSAVFALLAAAAAYSIGRHVAGRGLGLLSAALTLTAPILPFYGTLDTAYTLISFLAAMAFLAILCYATSRRDIYLVLAGTCLGLMFLCTYQAALYVVWVVPVAALVWRQRGYRALRRLLLFVGPVAVIGAPWYFRNWIVVGDPVYPWLYKIFGGVDLNSPLTQPAQASVSQVAHDVTFGFGQTGSLSNLAALVLVNRNIYPIIGPLALIGLLVGLSRVRGLQRTSTFLVITCGVVPAALTVLTGSFFLRYFIPVVPVVALLPAMAFQWLGHRADRVDGRLFTAVLRGAVSGTVRSTASLALVVLLIFPGLFVAIAGPFYHEGFGFQPSRPYTSVWYSVNPNPYAFNVAGGDMGFPAFQWIQAHLPPGSRVATYESRLYYLFDADYSRVLFLDGAEADPIWNESNPDVVMHYLLAKRVRYVWLSGIIQVGADHMPLTSAIVGNSPDFPIVWQQADAFIYGVGPNASASVANGDVTLNNAAMWSSPTSIDGVEAQSVQPTSEVHLEPAGALIANGPEAGYLTLSYRSATAGATLAVDVWTPGTQNPWSRLLTLPASPTEWSSRAAFVYPSVMYGATRLAFRPYGGAVYISALRFQPVGATHASLTLWGNWRPQIASDGHLLLVGNRATDPVAVRTQFADIQVTLPAHVAQYLDLQYADPTSAVDIVEKVGETETIIGTVLSAEAHGQVLTQRLALLPGSNAAGTAYLIFDTHGHDFAIREVSYVDSATSWQPVAGAFVGPWSASIFSGTVVGLARRDSSHWSDLSLAFAPSSGRIRLAFLDVGHAPLLIVSLDSHEKWHQIASITTHGTNGQRYVDVTAMLSYTGPQGGYYLILDTRGQTVPVIGLESPAQ